MSGSRSGGLKAKAKNLARDPDFYKNIGRKGGQASTTGGFAANPELARIAGAKAGRLSKRGHKYIETKDGFNYYLAKDTGKVVKYKSDS